MKCLVRAVSPGQMIRVEGFENPLMVTRVSEWGGLVWVEAFDPESVELDAFDVEQPTVLMSRVFDGVREIELI